MADPTNYQQFNERVSDLVRVVEDALRAAYGLDNIAHGETLGLLAGIDDLASAPLGDLATLIDRLGIVSQKYGLGGASIIPDNNDLNNAAPTGFYRTNTATGNIPESSDFNVISVEHPNSAKVTQMACACTNDASQMEKIFFRRRDVDGVWSGWVEMLHSGNVLGNISNGAIIERGSNANGDYVRLTGGAVIMSRKYSIEDWTTNSTVAIPFPIDVSGSGNFTSTSYDMGGVGPVAVSNFRSIEGNTSNGLEWQISIDGNGDNSGTANSRQLNLFAYVVEA